MKQIAAAMMVLVAGSAFAGDLKTYYDFRGNLNPVLNVTGLAQALEFRTGSLGTSSPAGSVNYTNELVGSVNKQVANFAAPQFFRAVHGIGANGGGDYLNQYSILMDIKFTSTGWASFFNTASNVQNDGDAFVNPDNAMGISGDYAGTFARNVWNRVIISVDSIAPIMSIYLNGAFVNDIPLDGEDGRWSLYTLDDNDTDADWVDIFADEDGDNASGQISALAFFDGALTANEAASFGTAGAPVPEPATLAALGLGAAALLRRRKK